jgi:hypothetical protein
MSGVSILRLNPLRAMYAFVAVGLADTRWPELLHRPTGLSPMDTVVASILGAISLRRKPPMAIVSDGSRPGPAAQLDRAH